MIGGDIFYNAEGKLPTKYGRIWYEADINYTQGQRNIERIVYSNDGLIFVTYNHYETFCEIE
jgi:guanyl-specific ribonuclease Sa